MAANTASIIPMARHKPTFHLDYRQTGFLLVGLGLLLLFFAIPQMAVGWLTAPIGLDHTRRPILVDAQIFKYERAMQILPQPRTAEALTEAMLEESTHLTTRARRDLFQTALRAVTLSPGHGASWHNLAAALEPEIFEPTRAVLFDQALTMSYMTAPYARSLILPRALMVNRHWDRLSQGLHTDWEDQIFYLWANAPWDLRGTYLALPPEAQRRVFAVLEQVPGESLKFNRYLDAPWGLPDAPPDATSETNP